MKYMKKSFQNMEPYHSGLIPEGIILNANESLSAIKVESKANVSEVDAFEAASELIRAQNQLTVSRQIYSMLNKQSLFDFI